jgi:peptide/nickel transport system ATP-binding protein
VILDPNSGNEVDLTGLSGNGLRDVRPRLQMIFQDPISSLNPRRRVRDIVSEGLEIWSDGGIGTEGRERVDEVLHAVGIDPAAATSHRPHQFSGGQCQRISIARALTVDPEILICDEPVSALDVSVQAKILNLLEDMKARYDLSLVFISHDLSVVRNVSDRVVVMYLGKICEVGDADRLYEAPAHPYTRALLASAPEPARSVGVDDAVLGDDIPSPTEPPSGCRFRTRCPSAIEKCATEEPQMQQLDGDHFVACHLPRV